jgi:hypothetical protein
MITKLLDWFGYHHMQRRLRLIDKLMLQRKYFKDQDMYDHMLWVDAAINEIQQRILPTEETTDAN